MKKPILFLLSLFTSFYVFAQADFLRYYGMETVASEKLEYRDGFLQEDEIDNGDYETCRIFFCGDFSFSYYYAKKNGNENAIKINGQTFVTGNEMCQEFDAYRIRDGGKTYFVLAGYAAAARFVRFFYIFDITDTNAVRFYKMVSDLFFAYQRDEDFLGRYKNQLCFFAVTDRWMASLRKKDDGIPNYYIAPYFIDGDELKEFAEGGKRHRVYFDFDFSGEKGVHNITRNFEK
ncbi:MAG: hypothetical protein K2I95_05325 [Treponemataceae bacterium]|nr:hypothetical protein [Treponemataceae bacterium]